ncbi:heme ABC transporter ATP-binding protein [Streptomyces sp. NPDC021020]|uniref:heme ABC transporter ATP-binding protein n=1 Tax=Streptomyces sp. NPDC021020 TaxID=3365109 RepID=UPI00378D7B73
MSFLNSAWRRDRTEPTPSPRAGEVLASARELRVRLGTRTVLDGVDLDVTAGEVLALVGPNGAGKSTLLAALAGDLPAAGGAVRIGGAPVAAWGPRQLARRRTVLPQSAPLAFPFTAGEVVRMGRAPWAGTPLAAQDDTAVAEAMAATEAVGFADRPFPALSGGERARVALARVLAQRAALLLLDEPTAALDLHHQELVLRVCREQAAAGRGVVVVLHDLGLAAAHADRVAVLAAGRVTACGPPPDVLTSPLLTEVYAHPVEVIPHPRTGAPLILPLRA